MRPSSRKYKDVIIDYLRDTPFTKADIAAADAIFGPNVGSLKGKTVRRPNEHIAAGIDPVPADVMKMHAQLILAIDIMFINKIAFFVTKSRELQFTTIEALPNRQVKTVKEVLRTVIHLYESRGFIVGSIMADNEFEPLRAWHPTLNTTAADKHVSKIERHIRTIKDSTRSTYRMLPFRHLPRIVLIHLVKNAVFWMNAFPTNDGITRRYSPCYVMTGQHVQASKHAVLEFGAYVQTHEQHTNDMSQRTMGCICLGPTGNQQGGHWFMSLSSGEKVVRYRWTELPMPVEAIERISNIGRSQGMPSTLTYANRHGKEIGETVATFNPHDASDSDSDDDDTYEPSVSSSNDSISDDDSISDGSDSDSSSSSSDDSFDDDSDSEDFELKTNEAHPNRRVRFKQSPKNR